ncbi:Maltose acetyltransferase-like protein [Arcticibacter svalbardensis MN12-7]|uniref:Maltose acetyltransferase-like protein n=1 Tax=Arcticibacter svalbardensis MN12-7 TaxID=1150600 RepID=R9GQI8_9SPHI|nr:acyltransferase [Arcticibacter svalbardensis]EOR94092.1 Maltose acetyltransferase-like protein [Arcticibacter svalbardensis MN12-7]
MKKLKQLFKDCEKSNSNFWVVLLRSLYYRARGKNIIPHQSVYIRGIKNISTKGTVKIGIKNTGFTHNKDVTYFNVMGKVDFLGSFSIGRGCRFDIGKDAVVKLGDGSYINPYTNIIIMHELNIGRDCAISWNCEFLDDDFHKLEYEGKSELESNAISIGDIVWIGSFVSIYKGTVIPDGCVIASHSVVKGVFKEKSVLIAGNPAKVVKRNISWNG